jgi:transposase
VIGGGRLKLILLGDSVAEEVGMALAITRTDLTAEELRGQARRAQDGDQACRLVALALVLEGASRTAAARAGGMDRQTLRDWVIRYNEAGVDGLLDRPRSGRRPRLNAAQLAELARLVEEGPDVAVHGVVRWRCIDLQAEIKARFDVELSERHIGRLLGQLRFTRLSVRPRHPQADEAAQQAFKKTSPPW